MSTDTVSALPALTSGRRAFLAGAAAAVLTVLILLPVQLMVDPPGLLLERFVVGGGWLQLVLLALYAAWLTGKMLDVRVTHVWRRRMWRLFSLVFFAQLALGLLGLETFLMTGKLHLPVPALIAAGPLYRGGGLFMPILFTATVLLVGSAWCSHLCYIGAWDDVAATRRRRAAALPRRRRGVQVALLALVVSVALGLRWAGVPGSVALLPAAAFGLVGLGVMLLLSRRTGAMVHCTAFCPMGVLATWLGRVNPFRIRIADGCSECGACSSPCRYDALGPEDIRRRRPASSCTLCGDCLSRCRDGRLGYRFLGLSPEAARALFVVLVVAGHASFLGVARI
jgi:polyferredoxin